MTVTRSIRPDRALTDPSRESSDDEALKIVARKHPAIWVLSAFVLLVGATIIYSFLTNPRWEWSVVAYYFTNEGVLKGLVLTLELTAITAVAGFLLGAVLAFMRLSVSPILRAVAGIYIWIFRSTPLLVQLLLWYNFSYLYRYLVIGVPFGPELWTIDTTTVIDQFGAAVLGLSLHNAAYFCEIVRGGVLAVSNGQREAAEALGIPRWTVLTQIIMPQAMRSILPAGMNEIISLLKGTSIVSVLSLMELFYTVQVIYAKTQQVLPMLLVATGWYVILTTVLTVLQQYVERHFSRGFGSRSRVSERSWLTLILNGLRLRPADRGREISTAGQATTNINFS